MGKMFPWTINTEAKSSSNIDVNVARQNEGITFPAAALHAITLDHSYHNGKEEKSTRDHNSKNDETAPKLTGPEEGKQNEYSQDKELQASDDPDDNIFDKLLCREQSLLDMDEQGTDVPKHDVSTVSEKPVESLYGEAEKREIIGEGGKSFQSSPSNEQPLFERLLCREKSLLDLDEQSADVPKIEVSTVNEKSLDTQSGEVEKKETGKVAKQCCSHCQIYKHNADLFSGIIFIEFFVPCINLHKI